MIDKPTQEETQLEFVANAKQQADIDYALAFRKEAFEQTRDERLEWRKSYERYQLARQLSEYDYVPDVPVGLTFDAVETAVGELPGREFGFEAVKNGEEDAMNALLFSEAIKNAWASADIMDGPTKMDNVKKQMKLFGSCFVQLYWDIKLDKDGNTLKSDPGFWPLNIFDVYYNKFYAELEDLPEIGYQSLISLDWLKANGKNLGYKNTDKVKGFSAAATQDEDSTSLDQRETQSAKMTSKHHKMVKLFEIQSDTSILTLALEGDGAVWLRKIPNQLGRKNCVLFRLLRNPLPNRLLGVTDIGRAGLLEDAIQRSYNQMIFNTLLVDNPGFTYNSLDRNIDPRTFIAAPGFGIPRGSDPNSITPITFNSHLNESLAVIANLTERYKRLTNSTDISSGQGLGQGAGDTATAASILDTNSKTQIDKIVDGMKGTMLKVAILVRKLYDVFGPESITIKVKTPELLEKLQGQGTQEMSKADFVAERDVDVSVDFTSQNKAVLSRRIVEFLQLTAQDPSVPPSLKIDSYRQWLLFSDLDELAQKFEAALMGQSDLNLADQENNQMAGGVAVPPTPGASKEHTQRHIEFMRLKETPNDHLVQAHIEGEIGGQAGGLPQPGQPGEQVGPGQPGQEATPAESPVAVGSDVAV